jgi:ABC-type glycerol-3-phosphate transport system substrate-binding protein
LIGVGVLATPALLAACGNQELPQSATGDNGATVAPVATGATAPSVAQQIELVHWDTWVTQGPWFDEEVRLFNQANPNITVKRVLQSGKEDPLPLAFKDGSAPDTFMTGDKKTFQEQIAADYIRPISDFPDYADFVATYPKPEIAFVEGINILEGNTYGAPALSMGNMWTQLYINTKVFKDAGLVDDKGDARLPVTFDDMLTAARTIKEKSGGAVYGYGNALTSWTPNLVFHFGQLSGANAMGGGQDWRTGAFTYSTNPVFAQVLGALVTMRDEGLIIPDSASVDDEAMRALFAQHKFGMLIGGTWVINGWKQTHPNFSEYTLTTMPLVGVDTPQSYYYTGPGGNFVQISTQTKYPEAAWEWFKWLHSKDAGERFVQSGNGMSVFPEANKPEYATNEAMRRFFELNETYTRIDPQPSIRNPDVAKIKIDAVKPDEGAIIQGIYSGQIPDIEQILAELDAAKTEALTRAVEDAKAAGANVSLEDYVFPDWDPTKDYTTKRAG